MTVSEWGLGGRLPDHIGVVVPDMDRAVKGLWELFQIGPWRLDRMPGTVPTWCGGVPVSNPQRLAFADWNGIQIELIQPLPGAEGPCQAFLAATGGRGGIHHAGFVMNSLAELERTAEALRERGCRERLVARAVSPAGDGDTYMFELENPAGFCLELSAPITITPEMLAGEGWYPCKPEE